MILELAFNVHQVYIWMEIPVRKYKDQGVLKQVKDKSALIVQQAIEIIRADVLEK